MWLWVSSCSCKLIKNSKSRFRRFMSASETNLLSGASTHILNLEGSKKNKAAPKEFADNLKAIHNNVQNVFKIHVFQDFLSIKTCATGANQNFVHEFTHRYITFIHLFMFAVDLLVWNLMFNHFRGGKETSTSFKTVWFSPTQEHILVDTDFFDDLTWCCSWTWGSSGGSWCSGGVQGLHSRSHCTQDHRGLGTQRLQQWFRNLIGLAIFIDFTGVTIKMYPLKTPFDLTWQYKSCWQRIMLQSHLSV